ncbi:unnamed protein product [Orchesella dallaii]|uniref:Secreted protein n=1 Tax=Orchesella dallaii TaxID=48710 RepID=A0ABP1R6C5_9HEXA
MKQFLITVALIASALVAPSYGSAAMGVRRMEISQPDEGAPESTLPLVQGARNCGGPGRVVAWRFETCGGEGICKIPGDDNQKRQSEFEFIPSQDSEGLGVRLGVVSDGNTKIVYEKAIANSAVQGGELYVMNALGGAKKDHIGKTVTLQYILYRVDTGDVEVCSEADFMIV